MDPLAQAHYELCFELRFRKARGDDFQKFFGSVMNKAYPGDFVQTRPWGRLGDDKCDGYLPSQRRFYQCYAPDKLTKAKTLKKLSEDFAAALPQASRYFDTWVFTHNAEDGRIPTWLCQKIEDLKKKHPGVNIELLGFEELRRIAFSLSNSELTSLLGPPVTQRAMMSLGLKELRPILDHLALNSPPVDESPRPVSAKKLAHNALPKSVETLLKAGMTKACLVEEYFSKTIHKERGERVSSAFREKYRSLRAEHLGGAEMFDQLLSFALGPCRAQPEAEVSGLAILAYLFEQCDIFESPPGEKT